MCGERERERIAYLTSFNFLRRSSLQHVQIQLRIFPPTKPVLSLRQHRQLCRPKPTPRPHLCLSPTPRAVMSQTPLESGYFSIERWQRWVAYTGLAPPRVQTEATGPCLHVLLPAPQGVGAAATRLAHDLSSVTPRPEVCTPAVESSRKGTGLRRRSPQPWNQVLGRENWGRGPGRQVPCAHTLYPPAIRRGTD